MVDHNHTASEVRGTVEPQASIPAPKPAGIWFPLVPFVGSTSGQVRGTQGTGMQTWKLAYACRHTRIRS